MKRFIKFVSALLRKTNGRVQTPKFYDLGLERRVREQLTIVTEIINAAIVEARVNHTLIQTPDLSGQIGHAGLRFQLSSVAVDGIVTATYTGPQAKCYYDILTKWADPTSGIKGVRDLCRVYAANCEPAGKGQEPTLTAQLTLPVKVVFSI